MADKVRCPACGKAYRWKDELAGRKVKCQCGEVFRMTAADHSAPPMGSPPVTDKTGDLSDGYDLQDSHLDHPAPQHKPAPAISDTSGTHCPSCNQPVKPGAIICVNCGFNLKSGQRLKTAVGAAIDEPIAESPSPDRLSSIGSRRGLNTDAVTEDTLTQHKWQDLYWPLIIIGAGVLLVAVNALGLMPMASKAMATAWGMDDMSLGDVVKTYLTSAGIRMAIQFPVMLFAIFLVARLFGSNYGSLWTGLLKLAAIALMVGAVNDVTYAMLMLVTEGLGVMGMEYMVQFAVIYGTFLALGMWLLEMDYMEASVMFTVVMMLPIVLMFFIGGMILALFA